MVFYDYFYANFIFNHKPQSEFIFRQLMPEDYPKFSSLLNCQRDEETVFRPIFNIQETAERIRNGEYCFICEDQGNIVAYLWFATSKKYIWEIQSTVHLAPAEVYSYNGYVRRNYRGNNIMSILRNVGRKELIDRGFKREITARMDWNYTAEKTILKSGFVVIGQVTAGFFLTFRYTYNTCRNIKLKNNGNILEFYRKLFQKIANAFKRS